MTSSFQVESLANIPAFKDCSQAALKRIETDGKLLSFGIGQALSTASIIPNRVLLIVKGKARFLGRHRE